ncbi:hypothetical protein Q8V88_003984 [Enterobacter hormaechei]|nr:hypothetical protein [Enterobacter hormaechei]
MSKKQLREKIEGFGFVEVADVLRFIEFVCSSPPEKSDYIFIRHKVELCLKHHDDGSNYFIELREFASELDAMISM